MTAGTASAPATLVEPGSVDLVVTDLDGTLWDRANVVHPRTGAAVRRLQAAGVHVLAASGRRPASIRKVLAANGLMMPAVCIDGALGRDLTTNDDFHCAGFDTAIAVAVLEALLSVGIEPVVDIVAADDRDGVIGHAPSTHPDHARFIRTWTRREDLRRTVIQERILGFGLCGQADGVPERCATAMPDGVELISGPDSQYGGHAVAIRPPGVNKWSGVEAYCVRHGIAFDRVLAVGDGYNDRELLAGAAIACAVADGDPELVRSADHVIDPPTLGGWAAIDWTAAEQTRVVRRMSLED